MTLTDEMLSTHLVRAFEVVCENKLEILNPSGIFESSHFINALGRPAGLVRIDKYQTTSGYHAPSDLEKVEKILCGKTLAVLDTGRFCICESVVKTGDVLVSSRSWPSCILLRKVSSQGSANIKVSTSPGVDPDYSHSNGETSIISNDFISVEWPYVDGLDNAEHLDREYAKEIGRLPLEDFRLF